MKKLFFTLFICLSLSMYSQTAVEIINNNDVDIYIAYVFYNVDNQSWDSKGWYEVGSYSTRKLNLGNYTNEYIYLHASSAIKDGKKRRWGEGISACVDPKNGFHLRAIDKINNCTRENFTKATVSPGRTVKHYYN